MATPEHSEPLPLENYVRIVALTPNLQRVFFYSATEFLHHSSTIELLLSLITYKGVLSKLQGLTTMREIFISLVAAVARKFIHGRHGDQYLESKRLTSFG